jgi:hypothetical protein
MSAILSALEEKFGKDVKLAGFFKKTSMVRTHAKVAFILSSYLDDRTKSNYPDKEEVESFGDDEYLEALFSGGAFLRDGKEIKPPIPELRVIAGGYLRESLGKEVISAEDIPEIMEYWRSRIPDEQIKKGHHMVFSQDPRIAASFTENGHNAHGLLASSVIHSLNKFQRQFYPNNEIGYVAGFHSDRHHPHLHVLLMPCLDNGRPLNISPLSPYKKHHRMDFQGYLKREFNRDSWASYLEFGVEPSIAKTRIAKKETSPERIRGRSLLAIQSLNIVRSVELKDESIPRRNLLPFARRDFLENAKHRNVLNEMREERYDYHVSGIQGKVETPPLMESVNNAKDFLVQCGESFTATSNYYLGRKEVFDGALEVVSDPDSDILDSLPDINPTSSEDQLHQVEVHDILSDYAATIYSEAIHLEAGMVPPHLEPDSQIDIPPTKESVQEGFEERVEVRRKELSARNSVTPEHAIIDKKLFDRSERLRCAKRFYFTSTLQERIDKAFKPDRDFYEDFELNLYEPVKQPEQRPKEKQMGDSVLEIEQVLEPEYALVIQKEIKDVLESFIVYKDEQPAPASFQDVEPGEI